MKRLGLPLSSNNLSWRRYMRSVDLSLIYRLMSPPALFALISSPAAGWRIRIAGGWWEIASEDPKWSPAIPSRPTTAIEFYSTRHAKLSWFSYVVPRAIHLTRVVPQTHRLINLMTPSGAPLTGSSLGAHAPACQSSGLSRVGILHRMDLVDLIASFEFLRFECQDEENLSWKFVRI